MEVKILYSYILFFVHGIGYLSVFCTLVSTFGSPLGLRFYKCLFELFEYLEIPWTCTAYGVTILILKLNINKLIQYKIVKTTENFINDITIRFQHNFHQLSCLNMGFILN